MSKKLIIGGTYYVGQKSIGNLGHCTRCKDRIRCLTEGICKVMWHRRWADQIVKTQKYTILQGSNAHRALQYLDLAGPSYHKQINFSASRMYILQLLVTGLIERLPRAFNERPRYQISEIGKKALVNLNQARGVSKPSNFWNIKKVEGDLSVCLKKYSWFKMKRVPVEFKLDPEWVERAREVMW